MANELPKGWAWFNMLDVINYEGGSQPPKKTFVYTPKKGYVRLLQIRDFGNKPFPTYVPDSKRLKKVQTEDLLIARYGGSSSNDSLGRICTGLDGAYNVALAKVIFSSKYLDRNFIKYLLQGPWFKERLNSISRSCQTGFNREDLANLYLPLPPRDEQKIIANKLVKLMARVESTNVRLEKIPKILKRFRQSVLAAAVSGRLTEDWRMKNPNIEQVIDFIQRIKTTKQDVDYLESEIHDSWTSAKFGNIFEIVRGSSPRPKKDKRYFSKVRTEFHWITLSDFTDNSKNDVLIDTNEFLTKEGIRYSRYVNQNDILVGVSGVYGVGRTCLLEIEGYIYDGIMAIKGVSEISFRKFIHYYLLLQRMKFMDMATGTSWPNINTEMLKKTVFPIPPLNEQEEIVNRVESLFKVADRIEERYKKAKSQTDKLQQSILAKAFRGELVPQDPNDEPASVLLENIKAEKEKLNEKEKKSKKKITKKAS